MFSLPQFHTQSYLVHQYIWNRVPDDITCWIRRPQLRNETLPSSNWEAFRKKTGKAVERSITIDGKAYYSVKSSVLSAATHRLVNNLRSTGLIHNQDSKDYFLYRDTPNWESIWLIAWLLTSLAMQLNSLDSALGMLSLLEYGNELCARVWIQKEKNQWLVGNVKVRVVLGMLSFDAAVSDKL